MGRFQNSQCSRSANSGRREEKTLPFDSSYRLSLSDGSWADGQFAFGGCLVNQSSVSSVVRRRLDQTAFSWCALASMLSATCCSAALTCHSLTPLNQPKNSSTRTLRLGFRAGLPLSPLSWWRSIPRCAYRRCVLPRGRRSSPSIFRLRIAECKSPDRTVSSGPPFTGGGLAQRLVFVHRVLGMFEEILLPFRSRTALVLPLSALCGDGVAGFLAGRFSLGFFSRV